MRNVSRRTTQSHLVPRTGRSANLSVRLWQQVNDAATSAGLDPKKFGPVHRIIINQIADYLTTLQPAAKPAGFLSSFWSNAVPPLSPKPVAPIIICGAPGTGKTTFLYALDFVLRTQHNLPDNIQPRMRKQGGQTLAVQKREFNARATSLLSVRKWTDILNFHEWDHQRHVQNRQALDSFISDTLYPMRVLLTDELEIAGYSPTIPTLAEKGILVVGTSNQYEFRQLNEEGLPPRIHLLEGADLRFGDPADAIVTAESPEWELFERTRAERSYPAKQFEYQYLRHNGTAYLLLDFEDAVNAPLLETDWIAFLQSVYTEATYAPLQTNSPFTILFDAFSLAILNRNYNGVIRFVSLFDAVEQLGVGVLVRNSHQTPRLSKEAIAELKTIIENSTDVSEEIKHKTLVGVDRCASRIGQAAYKAKTRLC